MPSHHRNGSNPLYKFNKKLDVADRLLNQKLAEDIIVDGKVVIEKGTKVTHDVLETLKPILADGYGMVDATMDKELDDHTMEIGRASCRERV